MNFPMAPKRMLYDNYEKNTCDICKKYYSGCASGSTKNGISLRSNASFTLHIKSDRCVSACIRILHNKWFGTISPAMSFRFPGDMLKCPP